MDSNHDLGSHAPGPKSKAQKIDSRESEDPSILYVDNRNASAITAMHPQNSNFVPLVPPSHTPVPHSSPAMGYMQGPYYQPVPPMPQTPYVYHQIPPTASLPMTGQFHASAPLPISQSTSMHPSSSDSSMYEGYWAALADTAGVMRRYYAAERTRVQPTYQAHVELNPWIPPAYYSLNPRDMLNHYENAIEAQMPVPNIGIPPSASQPHLLQPSSDEVRYGAGPFEQILSTSDSEGRYEHSVAQHCNRTISYPLGHRTSKVIIGFREQYLARNLFRLEDVSEAFKDGECPIEGCQMKYSESTHSWPKVVHLVNNHWDELSHSSVPVQTQTEFERDLMAWAHTSKISPNKFTDPNFHAFVLKYTSMTPVANSTYKLRTKLLVEDLYAEMKVLIGEGDPRQYFLTIGEWTNAAREPFLGALVVFIDRRTIMQNGKVEMVGMPKLRRRLVGFENVQSTTSESIKSDLAALVARAGLTVDDAVGIISDNCNSMLKLSELTHRLRVPCLAHKLESAISTLWTPKIMLQTGQSSLLLKGAKFIIFQYAISAALHRIGDLFTWIRASKDHKAKLATLQPLGRPLKVHPHDITQWDSTRRFLDCYMALKVPFDTMWEDYCKDKKMPPQALLTPPQFRLLSSVHRNLQCACHLQESLGEDAPTLPRVLPSMYRFAMSLSDDLKEFEKIPPEALQLHDDGLNRGSKQVWQRIAEFNYDFEAVLGPKHLLKCTGLPPDEKTGIRFDAVVAKILFEALDYYWHFFDLGAVWDNLPPADGRNEPERATKERALIKSYILAALSDPLNLDLSWLEGGLVNSGSGVSHRLKRLKDLCKTIYAEAWDAECKASNLDATNDPYLAAVKAETVLHAQEFTFLDEWWLEEGFKLHPIAFRIATKALVADATSREIERVNSQAALIDTNKRRTMHSESFSDNVMVTYNSRRKQQEELSYIARRKAIRYYGESPGRYIP